jgi:hypothetical protein
MNVYILQEYLKQVDGSIWQTVLLLLLGCFKISGVIGSFLSTQRPTDLIEPSLIVLTMSDLQGTNLRRHHVFIYDNLVKLFLESSKTDVYREGRNVLISKTNTPTCPVNMLLRYFYLAEIPDT